MFRISFSCSRCKTSRLSRKVKQMLGKHEAWSCSLRRENSVLQRWKGNSRQGFDTLYYNPDNERHCSAKLSCILHAREDQREVYCGDYRDWWAFSSPNCSPAAAWCPYTSRKPFSLSVSVFLMSKNKCLLWLLCHVFIISWVR